MADKIQKTRSSRKVSADSALSLHIAVFGAPAPMPCTNCFRNSRTCIVASNSKRCKECIDRKVACDGTDFAGPRMLRQFVGPTLLIFLSYQKHRGGTTLAG
jgi:hypothetical protein